MASVWQWLALRADIQPIEQVGIFASETDTENRESPLCAGRRLKRNEPENPARFCVPGTYYVRDTASCVFCSTKRCLQQKTACPQGEESSSEVVAFYGAPTVPASEFSHVRGARKPFGKNSIRWNNKTAPASGEKEADRPKSIRQSSVIRSTSRRKNTPDS